MPCCSIALAQSLVCRCAKTRQRSHGQHTYLPHHLRKYHILQSPQFQPAESHKAHETRQRSRRTCLLAKAAQAAEPASQGWKGEVAWWTLCAIVCIYVSGLGMLAPVLPAIIIKLNAAGSVEPAQAMGVLASTYAACMCVTPASTVVGAGAEACCWW